MYTLLCESPPYCTINRVSHRLVHFLRNIRCEALQQYYYDNCALKYADDRHRRVPTPLSTESAKALIGPRRPLQYVELRQRTRCCWRGCCWPGTHQEPGDVPASCDESSGCRASRKDLLVTSLATARAIYSTFAASMRTVVVACLTVVQHCTVLTCLLFPVGFGANDASTPTRASVAFHGILLLQTSVARPPAFLVVCGQP